MVQGLSLAILATTIIMRIWYMLLFSTPSHRALLEQLCLHEQQGRDGSSDIFSVEVSHPHLDMSPVLAPHPGTSSSSLSPFSFLPNNPWSHLHLACSQCFLLIHMCAQLGHHASFCHPFLGHTCAVRDNLPPSPNRGTPTSSPKRTMTQRNTV